MSEQKTIADLIVVWRDGGEALITTRKYPDSTERVGKVAWPVGISGYYLAESHVRPATFHPSALAALVPAPAPKPPAIFWSVRYKPGPPEALRMFPDEPAAQAWIAQGFKNKSLTGSREDWEAFPIYRGSLAEVSPHRATQDGPEAVSRAKEMTICEIIEDPHFTTAFKANRIAELFGAVAMAGE